MLVRSMRWRHPSAYTIIETLVVISIIALLTGLLLPALGAARDAARSAECSSNLRQMMLALQQYVNVHEAHPIALRHEHGSADGVREIGWDWAEQADDSHAPGQLFAFSDHPDRVLQCPAHHHGEEDADDPVQRFTGYNYNTSYIGGEQRFGSFGSDDIRAGVPPSAVRHGDRCACFGDGAWRGGANRFMRAPGNREAVGLFTIYAGGQAFRHRRATNIAFLDGHVGISAVPREGALATEQLLRQYMHYPKNGFLSDDDAAYDPR